MTRIRFFVVVAISGLALVGCQSNKLGSTFSGGNSSAASTVGGSNIQNIQATASDPNGVTKVEFYVNNALTCTVSTAVNSIYTCPWTVPAGSGVAYQLQTKAYDPQGNVGVSQMVSVNSH